MPAFHQPRGDRSAHLAETGHSDAHAIPPCSASGSLRQLLARSIALDMKQQYAFIPAASRNQNLVHPAYVTGTNPLRDRRDGIANRPPYRSETRDGMRIDWDVPIAMDDGAGPARRCFSPAEKRPLSGTPDLWSLCQGPRLPGRLSERVGAHGRAASGRRCGIEQPLSELGGGRSREMGAARLCLRARRFTRLRLLAGLHRPFLAA